MGELASGACPICGTQYEMDKEWLNKPLVCLENCPKCRIANSALAAVMYLALAGIAVVTGVELLGHTMAYGRILSLVGLALDVVGAFRLGTGYQDRITAAIGTLGGSTAVEKYAPRQTRRIRSGLVLLIFGFLLQASAALA